MISNPVAPATAPSAILPRCPSASNDPRELALMRLDRRPRASKGNVAPIAKSAIVAPTSGKAFRCAAISEAAPSVGPMHGLQTRPRLSPSRNCAATLSPMSDAGSGRITAPKRPTASDNRSCRGPYSKIAPKPSSTAAPRSRKTPPSRPIENPTVAMNKPTQLNDNMMPAPSAAGANRCRVAAVPKTTGRIGSTHGDNTDKVPAKSANARLPSSIAESNRLSSGAAWRSKPHWCRPPSARSRGFRGKQSTCSAKTRRNWAPRSADIDEDRPAGLLGGGELVSIEVGGLRRRYRGAGERDGQDQDDDP